MDSPLAYLNGKFVPFTEAGLPLYDAGFVYGATVADLVRTFRHQLFRLGDHLERFRQSCELGRVPQPVPDETLRGIANELVARNARLLPPSGELGLVLFATPGPVGLYGGTENAPPTLGMHTFPLPLERYQRLYAEGARLVIPTVQSAPASVLDARIKHRSRLQWWLASQQAKDVDPIADALLCDANGHVTETASANLLVVRDGTVFTPPAGTVLSGVSLQVVRELCESLNLSFREQMLTQHDCLTADELILTCSTWCLAGVRFFDSKPIPWPGRVIQQLTSAWSNANGLDFTKSD